MAEDDSGDRETSQSELEVSDSEDDFDVSESDINLIVELEGKLATNPGLYDAHVELIGVLRRCRMKERLREARTAMHERFPMNESLWLDWITDELDAVSSEEDVPRVLALLEDSHQDYLSVPLWIQHIE